MAEANPPVPAGPCRRERSRLRTSLPARLTTLDAVYPSVLLDVSLTGAKVRIVNRRGREGPIRPGERVVIDWEACEAFATVHWTQGDTLGVRFWEIVPPETLLETRARQDAYAHDGGDKMQFRRAAQEWVEGRTRFL